MAIKFKEVDDKLRKTPLNAEELAAIAAAEKFIDEKIQRDYVGQKIYIDERIANFHSSPEQLYSHDIEKQRLSFCSVRAKLMREELEKRYRDAGWKVETTDYHESSNYWVLSG